jgi:NAD-dependent DNA ligase
MAIGKVANILRARSDFSDDQIAAMSDSEAWDWVYRQRKITVHAPDQICFTGFSPCERAELEMAAGNVLNLDVKSSVTKGLRYLCTGPNAGPAKITKAQEQGATILSAEQFQNFCATGEIPE